MGGSPLAASTPNLSKTRRLYRHQAPRVEELEQWADNILDANKLDEIFSNVSSN
jgi:hypothetical protein